MKNKLTIAINAQILPLSGAGGVESAVIGLINALGKLRDGNEEYIIIGPWQDPYWLKPYIGPVQKIIPGPKPSFINILRSKLGNNLPENIVSILQKILGIFLRKNFNVQVPISNGFYEALGCDVIHFPYQHFVICALPSIYNPHDLQHLHNPQYFSPSLILYRENIYPAGCHFANTVVAGSGWVKNDIIKQYHVDPSKIQVIPWAPPTQAYSEPDNHELDEVKNMYQLNLPFCFYPAMTWPHKNHIRLLEAIALLRDRDNIIINLVCTGYQNDFWPQISKTISDLKLENQVKFLGMVSPNHLRSIYRLSQFVIIPTLFEAASGPLFEAWQENKPAACSSVTSLPEQAKDAALLFDPMSIESIANAITQMATNPDLRESYKLKGVKRLQDFSWERTAKAYRAVYRRAAGYTLNDEDQKLLQWDWMKNP